MSGYIYVWLWKKCVKYSNTFNTMSGYKKKTYKFTSANIESMRNGKVDV